MEIIKHWGIKLTYTKTWIVKRGLIKDRKKYSPPTFIKTVIKQWLESFENVLLILILSLKLINGIFSYLTMTVNYLLFWDDKSDKYYHAPQWNTISIVWLQNWHTTSVFAERNHKWNGWCLWLRFSETIHVWIWSYKRQIACSILRDGNNT